MAFERLTYRARQFWNAVRRRESKVTTEELIPYLSTAQIILFRQMHGSEQRHAMGVLRYIEAAGLVEADLATAALLHDVGKILSPLSIFDRMVIVVGKRLFPKAVKKWAAAAPKGWRRPFVVAGCHPEWGARLAEQAGASAATVGLIRYHQDPLGHAPKTQQEYLLAMLQAADDGN